MAVLETAYFGGLVELDRVPRTLGQGEALCGSEGGAQAWDRRKKVKPGYHRALGISFGVGFFFQVISCLVGEFLFFVRDQRVSCLCSCLEV